MDAFEAVVATILRHEGYWVWPSFKVELTKDEKARIENRTTPRPEIDILAYKGATNEILVVECKSFLNSTGVFAEEVIKGPKNPQRPNRYKLFNNDTLREVVFERLATQLVSLKACRRNPHVRLALVAGHIRNNTDRENLIAHFRAKRWEFWDEHWLAARLHELQESDYEDEATAVVAKLMNASVAKSAR